MCVPCACRPDRRARDSEALVGRCQIKLATAHGLMGGDPGAFRPDAPLTRAALDDLVFGLTGRPQQPTGASNAHVSLATLDRALVRGLELGDDARLFDVGARAAGLRPPARFGSEVVARLLGFRKNHEASNDHLELLPGDDATRAEAAYSAAQLGGNWMIHSSRYGVALARVAGWYTDRFAWGRRPLADAGLA
jgi:hypothetical protein